MRTRLLLGVTRAMAACGALVVASTMLMAPSASAGPGTITGQVFNDFGADGTRGSSPAGQTDSGLAGVTVFAYDNVGPCGSTTTAANGVYTLVHTCTSALVRVEFTTSGPVLDGLQPAPMAVPGAPLLSSGSTVQFVTANATDVNAGFLRPTDYCQANPQLIASCFYNGAASNNQLTNKALSKWAYGTSGIPALNADKLSAKSLLGSIYGLAHSRSRDQLFAAAVLRRHVGMGPSGLGAIYTVDEATGGVTLLKDLGAQVGTFDESARDLGASFSPSHDNAAAEQVGKVGIGDLAITDDETTLIFANLLTGIINVSRHSQPRVRLIVGAPVGGRRQGVESVCRRCLRRRFDGRGYVGALNWWDMDNRSQSSVCSDAKPWHLEHGK